ncbi:MAG: hypothetical protein HOW97_41795 [Catenulispora sp.]|nr:hypothetical protein [Catenulispora sp.]
MESRSSATDPAWLRAAAGAAVVVITSGLALGFMFSRWMSDTAATSRDVSDYYTAFKTMPDAKDCTSGCGVQSSVLGVLIAALCAYTALHSLTYLATRNLTLGRTLWLPALVIPLGAVWVEVSHLHALHRVSDPYYEPVRMGSGFYVTLVTGIVAASAALLCWPAAVAAEARRNNE